jgi:glycosyltransferase involved in cell wall biosynthesis
MSQKLRVLHLGTGNLYGGVETFLLTLARHRHLAPEMEPEFTICFEGRLRAELQAAEVKVHSLGAVRVRNFLSVLQARARLRELLCHSDFDVAICHSAWTQAIFGPVVRSKGLPFGRWVHGAPAHRHWLEQWAQRTLPDLFICNSRFTASLLPERWLRVPHEIIYCPVTRPDERKRAACRSGLRAQFDTSDKDIIILQASRMEPLKGHRQHIEALAQLKNVPGWVCWLVGGPQRNNESRYYNSLLQTIARHGMADRFRFIGLSCDVAEFLFASDLFCQPNVGPEGFGIAFVEALWAGLPVITTAIGGGSEIVDSSCGRLLPPADVPALAACLRQLIEDPQLRVSLSHTGPARAQQLCAPAKQVPVLADVLEQLVKGRRAA